MLFELNTKDQECTRIHCWKRHTISPFSIRLIFFEVGGNVAKGKGERSLAGIWGLIQELVTNDSYSGFYSRVAANAQDPNKLVVRSKLWRLRAGEP